MMNKYIQIATELKTPTAIGVGSVGAAIGTLTEIVTGLVGLVAAFTALTGGVYLWYLSIKKFKDKDK